MTAPLVVVVPTRSRPHNVRLVAAAWRDTDAFEQGAELLFAVDRDDSEFEPYAAAVQECARHYQAPITMHVSDVWRPMVAKLNTVASGLAEGRYARAVGFAGDDHLPRTRGWVGRYVSALAELGSGIVSCDDGYREDDLPTQWAMTSDIVRALGRMVPADVEHLYCDDSIRDLAVAAGAYAYLLGVLIEHMHPVAAGKGKDDEQYRRVNSSRQFSRDKRAYRAWQRERLAADAEIVRNLRRGETQP